MEDMIKRLTSKVNGLFSAPDSLRDQVARYSASYRRVCSMSVSRVNGIDGARLLKCKKVMTLRRTKRAR